MPQGDADAGEASGGDAGETAAATGGASAGAGAGVAGGLAGGDAEAEGGAAGEAPSAFSDGFRSGSRLRAILESAGSVQRFVGWHDTQLGIDCQFALDAEGTERCLPQDGFGGTAYSDANCKNRAALIPTKLGKPAYALDSAYQFVCGKGPQVLAVGKALAITQTYSEQNGQCLPDSFTVPADQSVYALSAAVPPSAFVAASEIVREARDARLSANVRVASDGSRETVSFFDRQRNAECNLREHQGADFGCVPEARAYENFYFSDAKCSAQVAYHPGYAQQVCGRIPTIVEHTAPFFTDTYFEVGAAVTTGVFSNFGEGCMPYTPNVTLGYSYYALGKAVAWEAFAQASSANEGVGRLKQNTLRNAGGLVLSRLEFYDSTLETRCRATLAADLDTRCLPTDTVSTNQFADAECKQPLFEVPTGGAAPKASDFIEAYLPTGGLGIFKLGPLLSAQVSPHQTNGPDCVATTLPQNYDVYTTVTVPASDMVQVTRSVE